ncbi:hypothetical protein BT63DRAFT_457975 [Microthyrium microscopicum]|uniref:Uncharacterized protein n=1 Tax=Microthyrium microscopicum TaxID=703497 RepID=A0A6A6U7F3_9PEZI|nr:hypothetical protein BT63DRAFT_457975 [Microthyrium microscopicum]
MAEAEYSTLWINDHQPEAASLAQNYILPYLNARLPPALVAQVLESLFEYEAGDVKILFETWEPNGAPRLHLAYDHHSHVSPFFRLSNALLDPAISGTKLASRLARACWSSNATFMVDETALLSFLRGQSHQSFRPAELVSRLALILTEDARYKPDSDADQLTGLRRRDWVILPRANPWDTQFDAFAPRASNTGYEVTLQSCYSALLSMPALKHVEWHLVGKERREEQFHEFYRSHWAGRWPLEVREILPTHTRLILRGVRSEIWSCRETWVGLGEAPAHFHECRGCFYEYFTHCSSWNRNKWAWRVEEAEVLKGMVGDLFERLMACPDLELVGSEFQLRPGQTNVRWSRRRREIWW